MIKIIYNCQNIILKNLNLYYIIKEIESQKKPITKLKEIIQQKVKDSNNKKRYGGDDYMLRMNCIQSKRKKNPFKKLSLNN